MCLVGIGTAHKKFDVIEQIYHHGWSLYETGTGSLANQIGQMENKYGN